MAIVVYLKNRGLIISRQVRDGIAKPAAPTVTTVILATVLTALSQMPMTARAQCINYAAGPRILATTTGIPDCNDIAARGDTMFMACADSGLVVGVLQPDRRLKLIGRARGNYRGLRRITIVGTRAYAVTEWAGLQIFDISQPTNPVWLGFVDTPGLSSDVVALPDRAFVADDFLGLVVIDTASPTRRISAVLPMPGTLTSIARSGHLIYCAVGGSYSVGNSLVIVDVTQADQPVIIGQLAVNMSITDIAGDSQKVVLVGSNHIFQVIEVSDPTAPMAIADLNTSYSLTRVSLSGDLALVNIYSHGLEIVDLANPAAPEVMAFQSNGSDRYRSLAFVNDVVVATYYDYTNFQTNANTIDYAPPGGVRAIAVLPGINGTSLATHAGYTYVATPDSSIVVVDTRNPAAPQVVGTFFLAGCTQVITDSGYLYAVANASEFDVYDLVDPAAPLLVASVTVPSGVSKLVSNGTLLLAWTTSSSHLYDISDPTAPVFRSSLGVGGAHDAAFKGQYVLLANPFLHDVIMVDVTDPLNPVAGPQIGYVWDAQEIVVSGDYAYISARWGDAGFRIFDVSQLPAITEVSRVGDRGAVGPLVVSNGVVYYGYQDTGLLVVDARRAASPVVLGTFNAGAPVRAVTRLGTSLVALDASQQLLVVPQQCVTASGVVADPIPQRPQMSIFPNPFNPTTTVAWAMSRAERVQVAVYDLAGRRLITVADQMFGPGRAASVWNGRDTSGTALPSGVYVVRVEGETFRLSQSVSLIK